ncbi:MAG TPA: hypothetical protein VF905_02760, partial [Nitrospirota bacterium]
MNIRIVMLFALLLLPSTVHADVGKIVGPLSCGIYDQMVKSFIQAELDTQHRDRARYTRETTTKGGRRLTVEVKNLSIKMAGERNHVTVFVDGKPYVKTSHQAVPLSLEVYIDGVKYRIICVRADPFPEPDIPVGE